MSKTNIQRLPNSFFRDNPPSNFSVALLVYANTIYSLTDDAAAEEDNAVEAHIDDARAARAARERQQIEQTDDPAVLLDMMRRYDYQNSGILSARIAALAEQTMPLLLKRYCTCLQAEFIELASLVFIRSDLRYTQALRELYPQIRAPYAQAHACLTFGIRDMTQEIPFLLEQYRRFQHNYPTDSLSHYPLLALYLLHGWRLDSPSFPRFQ